ncbi:hypothetical protein HaLaN_02219 [Haematococcus lacustris]|uniref:Uncharacterized protein n=1 Tax=Haematococcus lacustris TaxID=44745 RepID=A0A699YKN6_HAELA|nr:hypothetical protein HaLaN_02219 [Haematococcus lacustris]
MSVFCLCMLCQELFPDQLSSTPATHQLRQLPLAAAAQVLQNHLLGTDLKLSQADAELVAGNHGCNPRVSAAITTAILCRT